MLFEEMLAHCLQMCSGAKIEPRPWNPVSKQLRMLLGGKKTYFWFEDEDGVQHRLRVYRLPELEATH
jgi:hypothetical protein